MRRCFLWVDSPLLAWSQLPCRVCVCVCTQWKAPCGRSWRQSLADRQQTPRSISPCWLNFAKVLWDNNEILPQSLWGYHGEQEGKISHRFNAIPDKLSVMEEVTEVWVLGPTGILVMAALQVSPTHSYFPWIPIYLTTDSMWGVQNQYKLEMVITQEDPFRMAVEGVLLVVVWVLSVTSPEVPATPNVSPFWLLRERRAIFPAGSLKALVDCRFGLFAIHQSSASMPVSNFQHH